MDSQTIKQNILEKLANDSRVDVSKIGVIVDKGIVTLTGHVSSMEICARAEELASEVLGVRAIAQEIKHEHNHTGQPDDEEIAAAILSDFQRETMIPEDQLQIHVQNGCVVVKGNVYWLYQKNAVTVVLQGTSGILDMVNQINVVEQVSDQDLEAEIAKKFTEIETIDTSDISISCKSGAVTLNGTIDSTTERSTLLHAVNSVTGVRYVSDQITAV